MLCRTICLNSHLDVVCNIRIMAGTKMAGVIPIIGDNQFDRAVTLPKPMDFPAAKISFVLFHNQDVHK